MKEHLTLAVRTLAVLSCLVLGLVIGPARQAGAAPDPPTRSYYAYVCSESEDEVALVRYGPSGLEVVKTIVVGSFPAETEGPHGIGLDPDGRHWYVSLAHGFPFGSVHKYETDTDAWVGDVTLGMFPATLDVSAATGLLYVVNFDLHGPMEPGSISVVETDTMTEVERIPTGIMPHGSRLNSDGTWHYSVSMMSDEVVETDALAFIQCWNRLWNARPMDKLDKAGQAGQAGRSWTSWTSWTRPRCVAQWQRCEGGSANMGHAAHRWRKALCRGQQRFTDLRG